MLEPGTGRWLPHWTTSATDAWQPHHLSDLTTALAATVTSTGQGTLACACLAKLCDLVHLFQLRLRSPGDNSGGGLALSVRLAAGVHSLALCVSDELAGGGGGGGAGSSAGGSSSTTAAAAQQFDAVDVGCMVADHAGLLPVLISASPRLARHAGARLRVPLLWWGDHATSLREFVFDK